MSSKVYPSRQIPVNVAHSDTVGAVRVELVHTEKPTYVWALPGQTCTASLIFFDLFNAAGSLKLLRLLSIRALAATESVVTVSALQKLHLVKTTVVGTGGTAWTKDGSTVDAAGGAVCKLDSENDDIPTDISGRQAPTAGATSGDWLTNRYLGLDEDGTPLTPEVEVLPLTPFGQLVVLREGQGIKVVLPSTPIQSAPVGFEVTFTLE